MYCSWHNNTRGVTSSMPIFSFWRLWLLRSTSWRWRVSRHQASMLLSTLRTPPEEEGYMAGEGAAAPEWVERGPAEGEGTSIDMTGSFRNCGLGSVISWSFRNSILNTFSIIIMICGAYPHLQRAVLEMLKNEVKNWKGLLLDIELDKVPLILRTSCGISNARSQGGMEEAVKGKQLWQEVLDLWQTSLGARSVHKLHFLQHEHIIGVNPSLWFDGQ
jgi:hypothetical protein